MAKIEIEEREYETALYRELGSTHNNLWAPGQVLEAFMAFDYSTYTQNPEFWSAIGIKPRKGVKLNPAAPSFKKIKRPVPSFSLNLFVQAKRPHSHRIKAEAALVKIGAKSPRWKFKISQPQHSTLLKLARASKRYAYVCYAAPVFHEAKHLYAATLSGSVIRKSTFPSVLKLKGHHAWSYWKAGATGIANSEPTLVSGTSLNDQISAMLRTFDEREQMSAAAVLCELWGAANASSEEEIKSLSKRRREKYLSRREKINALDPRDEEKAVMATYCLHLMNYANAFEMIWLVVSPPDRRVRKQR